MKQKTVFAIGLCIVIICALSMAPALAGITEARAKELMYHYCQEAGYTKDMLEPYNFIHVTGGGWAFSLKLKNADPTTNGLVIGSMTEDGKLKEIKHPEHISTYQQLYEALLTNERNYEAMYHFVLEWRAKLPHISEEDRRELEMEHVRRTWPFLALLEHDIRLPEDGDISYVEAKKYAEAAILALPGWTQQKLDLMGIEFEVYHVPVGSDRAVYQFVYSLHSRVGHIAALYSGKAYSFNYDKAAKQEDKAFGKALPYVVSVRIDAKTGELRGDIFVEVPPVESGHAMALVLE